MSIFALYTNFIVSKKPEWLDEFLKKYPHPWILHVTLKQPCFIEEEQVDELKQKAAHFFSGRRGGGPMAVTFDEVVYNKEKSGAIMVCARNAAKVVQLQKDLCRALSGYTRYVDPITEGYEKNFMPHITIGDNIPEEQYRESLTYLNKGCMCEGVISEVTLAIVPDMTSEEAKNRANQTLYAL